MSKHRNINKLSKLLHEVLIELGEDPNREGLKETPERWADSLLTQTEGSKVNPEEHLKTIFELSEDIYPEYSDDMIIVDKIQFSSLCEHHITPFRGLTHIGYIPNPTTRKIVGLSKLSRVVDLFSQQLQIQERLTNQIAQAIYHHLEPLGVITVIQARHYCMIQRGVKQRNSVTTTIAKRGIFLENDNLENKFQNYIAMKLQKEMG